MDWLLSPLGLTIESQAEEYSRRLTDDRTGIKTWNMGDMFRDVLTPGTREDLEKAARDLEVGRINRKAKPLQGEIQENLAGTQMDTSDLNIRKEETIEDFNNRLGSLQRTGSAILNAEASTPNFDRSSIGPGSTAATVVAAQRSQTDSNTEAEKKDILKERLRQEGRETNLLLLQLDKSDRQNERQFQMQMAQNDYNNRRLDMQDARAERRDRQAMILQLMKGLAQMGQGIAI